MRFPGRSGDSHGGVGASACPAPIMPEYRRRLPHFQPLERYVFLTWRLWGSLPARASSAAQPTAGHAFAVQDRALYRCATGPLWLKDPRVASLAASSILIGESERSFYELLSWVVMPNHVHLLILPQVSVAVLMRWLKGSTARSANRILGRTGQPFWQDESFDHYLRSPKQIGRISDYIEGNPVSAGLVRSADEWPWSSAGWQAGSPLGRPAPPDFANS